MLSNGFSTISRYGNRATGRNGFHARAGIRWTALLICVFSLLAVTPALIALGSSSGQDGSGTTVEEGNSVTGKNLFTGSSQFEGGGPPCLACHSISGIGALGGGALGPNLTTTVWKGPALPGFMDLVLNPNMAATYPVMNAVWSNNAPLTPQERVHVGAFLQSADVTERSTSAVLQLSGLAVLGTLLMMGLTHITWLRRNKNVRRTMVGR